jgi:hypothetical protein
VLAKGMSDCFQSFEKKNGDSAFKPVAVPEQGVTTGLFVKVLFCFYRGGFRNVGNLRWIVIQAIVQTIKHAVLIGFACA